MLILLNNCRYFEELLFGLSEAFTELSIPHQIQSHITDPNYVYLLFTTHEMFLPLPPRYISYNIEQLTTQKKWSDEFFQRLRSAELVFDYSQENIKILKDKHIEATFLPISYGSCMNYHVDRSDLPHKYGFLGDMSDNRFRKLLPILSETIISNNCWGQEKKNLFSKIKYGVNVHFYEGKSILEVQRIIPLIANKIIVFSEKGSDIFYEDLYKDLVTFFDDAGNLPEYTDEEYRGLAEERYQKLITNCKYIDYIKPYVGLLKPFTE